MKILVTGSTGKVGSELLKELVKRKASVRALVRKADASLPPGVEPVVGDLLDPVSFEKALVGVDKLFLLNGVVADELTQGLIAFGLARKHKLQQIVYSSVFKAEHFKDVPHFASKVAIENAMKEFNVPFTILRPNYFYQNDLTLKSVLADFGVYPMPLGTPGLSAVDVRDIADAAAVVLTTEGHLGKTYNIVGPDVLSGPTVASIWSTALGKTIQYPGEHMDAFEEQLRTQVPSWAAYDFRMMMQGYLERGFAASDEDVAKLSKLLGHAPRRYADFADEAAQAWTQK
jgi:uncharacterized protein YbjT (DUF2867 family)